IYHPRGLNQAGALCSPVNRGALAVPAGAPATPAGALAGSPELRSLGSGLPRPEPRCATTRELRGVATAPAPSARPVPVAVRPAPGLLVGAPIPRGPSGHRRLAHWTRTRGHGPAPSAFSSRSDRASAGARASALR